MIFIPLRLHVWIISFIALSKIQLNPIDTESPDIHKFLRNFSQTNSEIKGFKEPEEEDNKQADRIRALQS